jgi:type I restriction enzyme S subunit
MIADLKPYPEYNESGLPWLGRLPGHWGLRRLRHLIKGRLTYGANAAAEFTNPDWPRYIRITDFRADGSLKADTFRSLPPNIACDYMVDPGDILLARSGATVGKAFLVVKLTGAACHAGYLIRARPNCSLVFSEFLFAFTQSSAFSAWKDSTFNTATIQNIGADKYANLPVPFPPPEEQAAIARFLDWANGRLQRAIRAKRKVIALLNEQKQAIIHRAVTRGLDPSAPLKPSGIPWLGDIPQHWDVQRTKNVFRLRTQKSGLAHGKELLSIYTHIGVRPRKDLEQKGNKASTTDDYWIVQKGDLIVNKLLAWMGAVGSSDYEGVTSPAYDILMPIRPLCSDYYHHLFRAKLYLQQFKQRSRGIMNMRLRLYFDQLGQIPVPFPPVSEQTAIVAFYVEATADLTATISRLEREIELLREYRTRLVADVVTGKLDVREAAARLPIEAAPDIFEDDADLSDDPEAVDEKPVA